MYKSRFILHKVRIRMVFYQSLLAAATSRLLLILAENHMCRHAQRFIDNES